MLHVFYPRINLSRIKIKCCKLQKVEDVLLFATKLADAARVTTTDQLVSQQDDVASNHVVVLANEKTGYTQLQHFYFAARQVCRRVEKRAASIFELFCRKVARRTGGFCCWYYCALKFI